MKKLFILILFLTIFLTGCNPLKYFVEEEDTPTKFTYDLQMLDYDNKEFTAEFSDIDFNALNNNITFTVKITDSTYLRYYYYLVLQDVTKDYNRSVTQFRLDSSTCVKTFSNTSIDSSDQYVFYIAKSRDNFYYNNVTVNPESGFSIRIPNYDSIKRIKGFGITVQGENEILEDKIIVDSFKFDFSLSDPEQAVSSVKLVVKPFTRDNTVFEKSFDASTFYSNGKIEVKDIEVTNVFPGCKYRVLMYGSGNNGDVDFKDVLIGTKDFSTSKYYYMGKTEYGLYAKINYQKIHEDKLEINLTLVRTSEFQPFKPDLDFELKIFPPDSKKYVTKIPLEVGTKSYFIDNSYLGVNYGFTIEETANYIKLASQAIFYAKPEIDAKVTKNTDGTLNFEFIVNSNGSVITKDSATIRKGYESEPFLTLTDEDINVGSNNYTVEMNSLLDNSYPYQHHVSYYINYYVTYIAFGKEVEETLYLSQGNDI